MSRSKNPVGVLPYLDVVEEALCFGWIDSTLKKLPDGRLAQRISPRRKNSHWTELNKQRCAISLNSIKISNHFLENKIESQTSPLARELHVHMANNYSNQ